MPVTIGILINPGVFSAEKPDAKPRSNRGSEYDTLSDRYARFLKQETLPEVGKSCNLTVNPNARAIGGISSGGIFAFTVARERPGLFRKVLSRVGSFANIRGGEVCPRDHPQGGQTADPNPPSGRLGRPGQPHGNRPLANQRMAAALKFAN